MAASPPSACTMAPTSSGQQTGISPASPNCAARTRSACPPPGGRGSQAELTPHSANSPIAIHGAQLPGDVDPAPARGERVNGLIDGPSSRFGCTSAGHPRPPRLLPGGSGRKPGSGVYQFSLRMRPSQGAGRWPGRQPHALQTVTERGPFRQRDDDLPVTSAGGAHHHVDLERRRRKSWICSGRYS